MDCRSIPPNVSSEQGQQVKHRFLEHHCFGNVNCFLTRANLCSDKTTMTGFWGIFGVSLIKDPKVFFYVLLGRFGC